MMRMEYSPSNPDQNYMFITLWDNNDSERIILCVHKSNNNLKLKIIINNDPYNEYPLFNQFIITPTVIIKKAKSMEEFKRINRQAIDYIRNHPDKLIGKLHKFEDGLTKKFTDAIDEGIISSSEDEEYFGLTGIEPLGDIPPSPPREEDDDNIWDPDMATPPRIIDYTTK